MNLVVGPVILRRPEPSDAKALYAQKNDPDIANRLGGWTVGYSIADINNWISHRQVPGADILWVVADAVSDECMGHVGLYRIDHRVRKAEFGIMLGDTATWGKGLGRDVSQRVLEYGFEMLNLQRIELSVLGPNEVAQHLYESLGFRQEGLLRRSQFKEGRYLDVVLMGLLREEFGVRDAE